MNFFIGIKENVAQSSTEAEYIAATKTTSQVIMLTIIFENIGEIYNQVTKIFSDRKSTIAMAKDHVFHKKARHIKIKYHFLRYALEDKEIGLMYCK